MGGNGLEKRFKRRFPMDQEVRYKLLFGQKITEVGSGRATNMSSSGMWFTTSGPVSTGMPVEISMNWPVLLNDRCAMKLMIYGCIVRCEGGGAAVGIERYEFRTQGVRPYQQAPRPAGVEVRFAN
jgi:hypothetical protein